MTRPWVSLLVLASLNVPLGSHAALFVSDSDSCRYPFEEVCAAHREQHGSTDPSVAAAQSGIALSLMAVASELDTGPGGIHGAYLRHLRSAGIEIDPSASASRFSASELIQALYSPLFPESLAERALSHAAPELVDCSIDPNPTAARAALELERRIMLQQSIPQALSKLRGACRTSQRAECLPAALESIRLEAIEAHSASRRDPGLARRRLEALIDLYFGIRSLAPGFEICRLATEAYSKTLSDAQSSFKKLIARSQPVIRSLESRFFAAENYSAADALIEEAKQDITRIWTQKVRTQGAPDDLITRASSAIAALRLNRWTIASAEHFTMTPLFPTPVLIEPSGLDSISPTSLGSLHSDGNFTAFMTLNASFSPSLQMGAVELLSGGIVLQPAFLLAAARESESLRPVLAHEVGHLLDPQTTAITLGADLSQWYRPLLSCFSDQLNLDSSQTGEAFADWIAAEVGGQRIAALQSPSDRKERASQMIRFFCLAQAQEDGAQAYFDSLALGVRSDPHPEVRVRRMYLFGSNPEIREALGCAPAAAPCTL